MVAWALAHKDHPILAQLVVIRRCNLACAYCNEYDKTSDPVAPALLERRLDALAALGTSIVTLTGGEPTLHPQLDDLIRRVRRHGMLAGLITNGFFLMPERIRQLNDAGLDHMQISIDNVEPDDVSMKSLKHLDRKLGYLAAEAAFHVNINSVLGAGARATDVLRINRRAEELGFSTSTGVLHDGEGQLKPLGVDELAVWQTVRGRAGTSWARLRGFEENLVDGRPNRWRCRAGARYLYVCEDGLVHYCSQRRGEPGIPVVDYTVDDLRRAFREVKACAPLCTLGCVHRVSMVDAWRA
jgi:MoaA/NifB/PqqE/SkfB family radical SAM enzyme